jgi:ferredoxin
MDGRQGAARRRSAPGELVGPSLQPLSRERARGANPFYGSREKVSPGATDEGMRPLTKVYAAIERAGFVPRGAVRLDDGERGGLLADVRAIVLIGVAGRRGWDAFAASPEAKDRGADPLDRFSRRVIDALAADFGAVALFPFGGPPHWPFQQWARRAEPVHRSPIGVLIHPTYGLWHAYRGALAFVEALDVPPLEASQSPCGSCGERPCLNACPVGAFSADGYDVAACAAHLKSVAGADCMSAGCLARRACPVGAEYAHGPEQTGFTMRAFLRAREGCTS